MSKSLAFPPCPVHGSEFLVRSRATGDVRFEHVGCIETECEVLNGPECKTCRGRGIMVATKLRPASSPNPEPSEQRIGDCLICGEETRRYHYELPTPADLAKRKELMKRLAALYRKE